MSATNDLIDYVVAAIQTSSVFTDFNFYTVSQWFEASGNLTMPCVYVHFNNADTVLHHSGYEYNITFDIEMYVNALDTVTDDSVTEKNIQAAYYYGEELINVLTNVSITGKYYTNDVRLVNMPVMNAIVENTVGALAQITFGARKNIG